MNRSRAPARLGQAERKAEEDRVARRNVGDGNALARRRPWERRCRRSAPTRRTREGRAAGRCAGRQAGRDLARGLELDPMTLVVVDRQRDAPNSPARARCRRRPSNRARRTAGRRPASQLDPHPRRRPEPAARKAPASRRRTIAMLGQKPTSGAEQHRQGQEQRHRGQEEPEGADRKLGDPIRDRRCRATARPSPAAMSAAATRPVRPSRDSAAQSPTPRRRSRPKGRP